NHRTFAAVLVWWLRRLGPWVVGGTIYLIVVAVVVVRYSLAAMRLTSEGAVAEGFVLGLLMAFRNRAAYDRWWEGRRLWGQLVNDMRNLAWKVRSYLPADAVAASRLPAAMIGFAEALKYHLRGGAALQKIRGFEKDAETPAHVPSYLAGLVLAQLAAWGAEGRLDTAASLALDVHARSFLDVCGGCERIRNTGISSSYKNLIRLGLLFNLIVAPWMVIPNLSWWGVPALWFLLVPVFGVEIVDSVVEEPFGEDPDDLDLDRFCLTIDQSVTAALGKRSAAD
ncbi:MAG TPA: bestrophin family ion channel, partial [Gemmataceae bacterium]|nr:bestrophin family ion channel [Gemmataceae bacterium]